jgi:hypothetical protein
VLVITKSGILLSIPEGEFFLPYSQYPWFREAKVSDVLQVELLGDDDLRWEALDVDLEVESIIHPERYPLTYQD